MNYLFYSKIHFDILKEMSLVYFKLCFFHFIYKFILYLNPKIISRFAVNDPFEFTRANLSLHSTNIFLYCRISFEKNTMTHTTVLHREH